MKTLCIALFLALSALAVGAENDSNSPQFTSDGLLQRPSNYRDWVYLTSGIDMSYSAQKDAEHHMFDNVFVNPAAYRFFLQNGTWPDGAMLLIEARAGATKGSINQRGSFQTTDVMAIEVHVKDSKRFDGGWGFFGYGGEALTAKAGTAKMIPTSEECYSCHATHAAVDTTFVQFYPTLIDIAKAKGTLSTGYLKEGKDQ